jgi:glucose-1-phosphate cytidylyltransferase
MQVVILAGGLGSRLGSITKSIPKPMVKIKNKPIIYHIMEHYSKFNYKNFIIATGYKKKIIENFFSKKGIVITKQKNFKKIYIKKKNWNIKLIYTGDKSMTGGRILKIKKYINNKNFLLTYGDGISSVNIDKLVKFHFKHKPLVTITAVRPPARFGELKIKNFEVKKFKEKVQINNSWINGGYFVMNYKFFNYLKSSKTILEQQPLENISKQNKLNAYKHYGFWHCMDTVRDKNNLKKIFLENKNKWPIV